MMVIAFISMTLKSIIKEVNLIVFLFQVGEHNNTAFSFLETANKLTKSCK